MMNFTDANYDTLLYLDAIWRRKYILLLSIIIMPILAVLSIYILPQKYMASTSVEININALPAMKDISTPIDIMDRFQGLKAFILSPDNLQKIVPESGLVKPNAKKTVITSVAKVLSKGLTVTLLDKSVIEIQLIQNKPAHMVDILNLISKSLMQQFNSQEKTTSQASMEVLSNALQQQKQKLKASIEALSKYEKTHSDSLPEYGDMYQNQLRQINNSLGEKRAQYSAVDAEKQELEQALLKINPIITEIDRSILANDMKLSKLRLIYTDNYPDIKALLQLDQSLKVERDKLQKQKQTLDANKIQQLWNMTISEPSGTKEKGNFQLLSTQLEKLINMQLKLTGMKQEIANLTEQQNNVNKKLQLITDNKQILVELQQTIKDEQTTYEAVLSRNNLAKMSVGLNKDERSSIVKIVSYPENPTSPLSRPTSFLLFVGLIAGILLGISLPIVLELMDNTARNKRAIEAATGFEVICRVQQLSFK